jgi:ornithine cyclodeaminase/alanine dehydrogenase-like protein (mu-crystallin family)
MGADDETKCELDATVLRRAKVFVDARDTAATYGDIRRAIDEGTYSLDQISAEIGDVLAGRSAGRLSSEDITVAKLVGIGTQDLVAAEVALRKLGILPSAD